MFIVSKTFREIIIKNFYNPFRGVVNCSKVESIGVFNDLMNIRANLFLKIIDALLK